MAFRVKGSCERHTGRSSTLSAAGTLLLLANRQMRTMAARLGEGRTMKGSKAVLTTLAVTAGLLVLIVGLWWQYPRLAAQHWRAQLDTVPDDHAGVLLRQVAALGEPGIPVLVEALGSERESVARAGKQALLEQLDRWQILRGEASSPKLAILADALAERVEQFGPTARKDASDLAARILLWPLDSEAVDRRLVIVSCESVFRATAVRRGVLLQNGLALHQTRPVEPADNPRQRPLPPATAIEPGASLVDLSRLPGGGLLIESFPQPAVPQRAGTTWLGDVRAKRPRRLAFPRSARRLDTWRQADRPSATEQQPGERPGAITDTATPSDPHRPPLPNPGRALSLLEPVDAPAGSPPGEFSEMETTQLMQWLDCGQEPKASGARAELIRRGFTEVHLDLSRRLFDPDPEVRIELARLLPGVRSVDAMPWLLWLSRDADPEVRRVAIGLIATTGDARLLDQIEQAAREDPDPRIRRQAQRIAARRNSESRR